MKRFCVKLGWNLDETKTFEKFHLFLVQKTAIFHSKLIISLYERDRTESITPIPIDGLDPIPTSLIINQFIRNGEKRREEREKKL